jgi:hypothetical protein
MLSLRTPAGGGDGGSYFWTDDFSGRSVGADIRLKFRSLSAARRHSKGGGALPERVLG